MNICVKDSTTKFFLLIVCQIIFLLHNQRDEFFFTEKKLYFHLRFFFLRQLVKLHNKKIYMEINKPDLGVFKGIGRLEITTNVNRKFFPNVRNIHHFDLSHNHRNEYRTNYSTFHKAQNINQTLTEKVKKHPNASQIVFGNGGNKYSQSWGRAVHGRFDFTAPPKPIKQKEEGLGINEYEKRTGEKIKYSTTTQEVFQQNRKHPRNNPTYKYTRTDRFNPITGEKKGCTSFGFEDYAPNTDKKYKANNFTVLPSAAQKYDILNGRRLTYI